MVYLDGARIHVNTGSLHHEWWWITNWQLGSGCISGGAKGEPSPGHCGWYGFSGLIDEFIVWSCVVSANEIVSLSRGDTISAELKQWSLKRAAINSSFHRDVNRVHCSRPQERVAGRVSSGVSIASPPGVPSGMGPDTSRQLRTALDRGFAHQLPSRKRKHE